MEKKYTRPIVFLFIIILLFIVGRFTSISKWLSPTLIKDTLDGYGIIAPIIFITLYIVAVLFFLPATPFTIVGGFVFGIFLGTIYVVVGATIGATLAFIISRYFGEDFVAKTLKDKFKKINEYDYRLKENGFITVLILRLLPIFPFNMLNFGLGITKVKLKDYVLATLLGIIPGTFMYIYIGNIIGVIGEQQNIVSYILTDPAFYLFIVVFVLLIVIVPKYTKKRKKDEI